MTPGYVVASCFRCSSTICYSRLWHAIGPSIFALNRRIANHALKPKNRPLAIKTQPSPERDLSGGQAEVATHCLPAPNGNTLARGRRDHKMARDNTAGIQNVFLKIVLFPGMFFQWLLYIQVGGRPLSTVVQRTRLAKSPAMTWVFSAIFYVAFYFLVVKNWR